MSLADLIIYGLVIIGIIAVIISHRKSGSGCASCPSHKNSFVDRYKKDQKKLKNKIN